MENTVNENVLNENVSNENVSNENITSSDTATQGSNELNENTTSSEVKSTELVEIVKQIDLEVLLKSEPEENTESDPIAESIKLIGLIITSNDKFTELISKSKISIPEKELEIISNVLNYLNNQSNQSKQSNQLTQIINELSKVLSDGKLELHEIPELISVIHTNIKDTNIKLSGSQISLLLKVIIYILMEVNVIKINSGDFDTISKVIDASLKLLELYIGIPTNKKMCKCLPF